MLANNGFSNRDIERITKNIIDKWYNQPNNNTPAQEEIKLFYKGLFSNMHQEDERAIKQIVKRNVKPVNPEARIKFTIYYKSKKTSHLLLKNSPKQDDDPLKKSHVIYRYSCKKGNCAALTSTYIGMTTTKLGSRLTNHRYLKAPKNHMEKENNIIITKEDLDNNTEILATCSQIHVDFQFWKH